MFTSQAVMILIALLAASSLQANIEKYQPNGTLPNHFNRPSTFESDMNALVANGDALRISSQTLGCLWSSNLSDIYAFDKFVIIGTSRYVSSYPNKMVNRYGCWTKENLSFPGLKFVEPSKIIDTKGSLKIPTLADVMDVDSVLGNNLQQTTSFERTLAQGAQLTMLQLSTNPATGTVNRNCANWAKSPVIYMFADAVIITDREGNTFNSYSHEQILTNGCQLPAFEKISKSPGVIAEKVPTEVISSDLQASPVKPKFSYPLTIEVTKDNCRRNCFVEPQTIADASFDGKPFEADYQIEYSRRGDVGIQLKLMFQPAGGIPFKTHVDVGESGIYDLYVQPQGPTFVELLGSGELEFINQTQNIVDQFGNEYDGFRNFDSPYAIVIENVRVRPTINQLDKWITEAVSQASKIKDAAEFLRIINQAGSNTAFYKLKIEQIKQDLADQILFNSNGLSSNPEEVCLDPDSYDLILELADICLTYDNVLAAQSSNNTGEDFESIAKDGARKKLTGAIAIAKRMLIRFASFSLDPRMIDQVLAVEADIKSVIKDSSDESILNIVGSKYNNKADEISPQLNMQKTAHFGYSACFVDSQGDLYCLGWNRNGQVGNGVSGADVSEPTRVSGLSNVVDVEVGFSQVCALEESGFVKCWGKTGKSNLRTYPEVFPALTGALDIEIGYDYVCGLMPSRQIKCEGSGVADILGGDALPTRVETLNLTNVDQFSISDNDAIFALSQGKLYGIGKVNSLQGTGEGSLLLESFEHIKGTQDIAQFDVSTHAACAVRKDGSTMCWGYNYNNFISGMRGKNEFIFSDDPVIYQERFKQIKTSYTRICGIGAAPKGLNMTSNQNRLLCWGYDISKSVSDIDYAPKAITNMPRDIKNIILGGYQGGICVDRHEKESLCLGQFNLGGFRRYDQPTQIYPKYSREF